ncbi:MAG TPA: hypothetical protein VLA93_02120 [Pyrinomonadaceae bacterium]|nr:hypothetical protein [Pyrinomonadaceae bacterium]
MNGATYDQNSGFVIYQEVLPGFGRLMSQGALSGALSSFLCIFFKVIIFPHNYYDGFLVGLLLVFLIYGAVFGLITALVVWAATKIIQRRLGRTARLMVTSMVGISLYYVFSLLLSSGDAPNYSQVIPVFMVIVVTVGLITGSRYHPERALLQGMRASPGDQLWSVILIGFLLRVLYVFLCMQFLLGVILAVRDNPPSPILLICLSLLAYCLINAVFSFDNAQSLWLAILAIFTNAALIVILIHYWEGLVNARHVIIGYLALWLVFLLANRGGFTPLLSSIKEELRYYCIID